MKTKHILSLLDKLAEKENESPDHYGFLKMSEALCQFYAKEYGAAEDNEIITRRYLYEVYGESVKRVKEGREYSRRRINLIDIIARYLGYPSFKSYVLSQEVEISAVLTSCVGNWWSYVRANAGEMIFKAPVRIYQDSVNHKVYMELRSRERVFRGEVSEESGCLTTLLESGAGKKLALIFKLGNTRTVELLQGVFCGISSAGDPISGRELLLREKEQKYEEMQWISLDLNDAAEDARILSYFSQYAQNCIKIRGVSSFNLNDLDDLPG